jgi:hypothetical protein
MIDSYLRISIGAFVCIYMQVNCSVNASAWKDFPGPSGRLFKSFQMFILSVHIKYKHNTIHFSALQC